MPLSARNSCTRCFSLSCLSVQIYLFVLLVQLTTICFSPIQMETPYFHPKSTHINQLVVGWLVDWLISWLVGYLNSVGWLGVISCHLGLWLLRLTLNHWCPTYRCNTRTTERSLINCSPGQTSQLSLPLSSCRSYVLLCPPSKHEQGFITKRNEQQLLDDNCSPRLASQLSPSSFCRSYVCLSWQTCLPNGQCPCCKYLLSKYIT